MPDRLGLLALGLLAACGKAPPDKPGVFVLGIDGMDPQILGRLIEEGRMPHFKALAEQGGFQPLGTSNPPQSPVAWSTFVTGLNPGGHGIYDFIHRDPKTYLPISSATPPVEPGEAVEFFGYYLPVGGDSPSNNRSGLPFWDPLHDAGVDVAVYRVPGNYPPPESKARVLSGMGTVDMRGGYGTYTWYTDGAPPEAEHGEVQLVSVADDDLDGRPDTVRATLKGPPDLMRFPPDHHIEDNDYLTAPVTVTLDPDADVVLIQAGDSRAVLQPGEWSDWMSLTFEGLPHGLLNMDGIVRFYLKSARPTLQLYASPVNISPASPAQDISSPTDFATDLYDRLGYYYTQGMPEETNALKDHVFDDDDYARQVALVQQDTRAMLADALDHHDRGHLSFVYLSDIDLQCHMLWRLGDPKTPGAPLHPAFEPHAALAHGDDIEQYYQDVDAALGEVVDRIPEDSLLIVMSDHGFQPFTRKVHLNAWLRDHGYLVLKDGKQTGQVGPDDVDWSKTRAYGLGFNGLYLNLAGREGQGIVRPEEVEALTKELKAGLLALQDPKDGASVVLRVDTAAEAWSGPRLSEAPDLVVGYAAGFGCSDESTLGKVTEGLIEDNQSRWSGNHLMAPEVVPGVLLSNRPLAGSGYDLTDITATLLAWFDVPPAPAMEGHSIFANP